MPSSTTRRSTCAGSPGGTGAEEEPMSARAPTSILLAALLTAALALAPTVTSAPAAPNAAGPPRVPLAPIVPKAPRGALPPCGTGAAEVLATTAGSVAQRIYAAEVVSSETLSDTRQVESYGPLLSAVESGERAAINAAVTSLVFSHTHIVRLRVNRGSELLADVGGPYILAPVGGTLRSHGRSIGHFIFSVQDDLGYVKLVTRFIGAPLILRTASGQVTIEGLLSPGPASIPDHGPVVYRHVTYQAYSFNASAYPSGRLRVSLFLPLPGSLSAKSCTEIKIGRAHV